MQSGIERELTSELPFQATFVGGGDMVASSDAEQKFERVKTQLKARLGAEVYSSWFGRMKVAEASRGIVRISVPTAFLRSWINGHYLDLIAELWKHEDPEVLKIEIVVRTATRQTRNGVEPEVAPARKMTRQTQTALAAGAAGSGRVERAPAPRQG
ncbi:chromosomal replication initiator protein DnaA, partial [Mesorhizobium sp. M4B.F.Ca.ET.019.03.1.1]|uniref:DnaA N-terminal domain-containing protein n=2 Tax=unclassified Mesorhizobium TaxID=325217 RepID=UPI000FD5E663